MSATALKSILSAMQNCLDAARLISDIRPLVREPSSLVSEYEECIDVSLSNGLELLSGLMDAYSVSCGEDVPYIDLGEPPCSHQDAVRSVNDFLNVAIDNVRRALNEPAFVLPSAIIGVRAQTFSYELREIHPSS